MAYDEEEKPQGSVASGWSSSAPAADGEANSGDGGWWDSVRNFVTSGGGLLGQAASGAQKHNAAIDDAANGNYAE